jgi:hypothetical protein
MTYHQLRHGLATLLKTMDIDARTTKEILGHANVSTTLDIYTHIDQETTGNAIFRADEAIRSTQEVGLASNSASNVPVGATISQNWIQMPA